MRQDNATISSVVKMVSFHGDRFSLGGPNSTTSIAFSDNFDLEMLLLIFNVFDRKLILTATCGS